MGVATIVIIGNRDAAKGVNVWGLASDGSSAWTYDTGAGVATTRVIRDSSGNYYIGGDAADNGDGNGTRNVWKLDSSGNYLGGAYVGSTSTIRDFALDSNYLYVAAFNGAYRLDLDLTNETTIVSGGPRSAIGVDSDGNIIVGGGGSYSTIRKYNSSLVFQWSKDSNHALYSVDFLSNKDIIVGTSAVGEVRMYASDGSGPTSGNWRYVFGTSANVRAVVKDNVISAVKFNESGGSDERFVVLNSSGARQWGITTPSGDLEDIVLNSSGVPFVVGDWSKGHNIFEVDTTNQKIFGIAITDYVATESARGIAIDPSFSYSPDMTIGFEGFWRMNDNIANKIVSDMTLYLRNGTSSKNTSAMSVPGKINNALTFVKADSDKVDFGDHSAFDLGASQDKTYAFWCNWGEPSGVTFNNSVVLHKYYHSSPSGFVAKIAQLSGYLQVNIFWAGGGSDTVTISDVDVSTLGWFLVVVRVDRSGRMYVSINNAAYSNFVDISSEETNDASNSQSLAAAESLPIASHEYFDGELDAISIWSRLLTEEEEYLFWNEGNGTEEVGLVVIPTISDQSSGSTIVVDQAVSLFITATGDPTPTYQWYKNGNPISGETNSTLNFTAVADSGGIYTCKATNVGGSATSADIVLSMAPLILSQSAVFQCVPVGKSISLSVTATGFPSPVYQWYKSGGLLAGETSSTLSFPFIMADQAGVYTCRVTNALGTVESQEMTLIVISNIYEYNPFNLNLDLDRTS
jgi:hypothetical protein